ncbi:MAG TPA: hypothetical protein VFK41_05300 [Nocardioidaceae bacterium]|nr:hypothetical protein [Nocardioidaceae bacterium]
MGLSFGAALIALTTLVSPVEAAQSLAPDPVADVWLHDNDYWPPSEAGSVPNTDVVRTTVAHQSRRVAVKVHYADLRRNDDQLILTVWFRTNEGLKRLAYVAAGPERRRGTHLFGKGSRGPGSATCKGLRHTIDYTQDLITISIPRSCLSRPRWVQFQGEASTFNFDEVTELFVDDLTGIGYESQNWSAKIRR